MASRPRITCPTPEEYTAVGRRNEYKGEHIGGEVAATVGASRRHNIITFDIAGVINPQLSGRPCEGHVNDTRARIAAERECAHAYQADGRWALPDHRSLADVIEPASVRCSIAPGEVYDKVSIPAMDLREGEGL